MENPVSKLPQDKETYLDSSRNDFPVGSLLQRFFIMAGAADGRFARARASIKIYLNARPPHYPARWMHDKKEGQIERTRGRRMRRWKIF